MWLWLNFLFFQDKKLKILQCYGKITSIFEAYMSTHFKYYYSKWVIDNTFFCNMTVKMGYPLCVNVCIYRGILCKIFPWLICFTFISFLRKRNIKAQDVISRALPYSNISSPGLTEFGPLPWQAVAKQTASASCQLQPTTEAGPIM